MDKVSRVTSGNKVHRGVLDDEVTAEDIRVAREELNETPETREVALRVLRQMLLEQNEFTPRTDDVYLLRFLRVRKFNCERALKTIKDHYKYRHANPGIYPAPSEIEKILRLGIFNLLPHRDHKGRAVFVISFARWNLDWISFDDFMAAGNLVAEYVLDNAVTQINGYIGIWDFKGFTWKHSLSLCTPKNTLLLCQMMQDRFPGRFKIAYCVNCHSIVNTAFNLIKPFLREKFRNRVKILGQGTHALHEYVDKNILPVEFGGPLPSLDSKEMAERVLEKESYVNFNRKFGY